MSIVTFLFEMNKIHFESTVTRMAKAITDQGLKNQRKKTHVFYMRYLYDKAKIIDVSFVNMEHENEYGVLNTIVKCKNKVPCCLNLVLFMNL